MGASNFWGLIVGVRRRETNVCLAVSLIVVLIVSTVIGSLAGLSLGGWLAPVLLAVIAGFLGTIAAGIVRNRLLIDVWGSAGMKDAGTPAIVVTYAAVASLAGSLAADRIALLIGAMFGLLRRCSSFLSRGEVPVSRVLVVSPRQRASAR